MRLVYEESLKITKKPETSDFTHIDTSISYIPDESKRGFYLRIYPVKHEGIWVIGNPYDGISIRLPVKVSRYSEKKKQEAIQLYQKDKKRLIDVVAIDFKLEVNL